MSPGVHAPAHAPATQLELAHATAAPHVPTPLQVCTPLFEPPFALAHWVLFGEHWPAQPPATHA